MATPLTEAPHHFIVGEHRAEGRAPVDLAVGEVGEAIGHEDAVTARCIEPVPLVSRERAVEAVAPRRASGFEEGALPDRPVEVGIARRREDLGQGGDGTGLARLVVVPVLEQAGEDPLRPAVIVRAARPHLPAPVIAEAEQVELAPIAGDVALGRDGRMLAGLDGVLLGGQAKAVVALGVQDVEPALALVSGDHVRGDVAKRVADVESRSTRVGEHVQHVVLRSVCDLLGAVGSLFGPFGPPLGLDGLEVVFHCPERCAAKIPRAGGPQRLRASHSNPRLHAELWSVYSTRVPKALPPLFPEFVWEGTGAPVHLTFDDGPHPEWTPFVLDELARTGQKGTFFCVGENIERHPDVFDRIRREGHAWGNHTMRHESGWATPNRAYLRSYLECEALTGSGLFRPPYGRIASTQARAIARRSRIVMWTVLTGDFDPQRSATECQLATERALRPGAIVVMHDSAKAGPRLRELLPGVLDVLSEQGWSSAPLAMERPHSPEDSDSLMVRSESGG